MDCWMHVCACVRVGVREFLISVFDVKAMIAFSSQRNEGHHNYFQRAAIRFYYEYLDSS